MTCLHLFVGTGNCHEDAEEIIPKYMFELPSSELGIFQNAAVVTDAIPCAQIAL